VIGFSSRATACLTVLMLAAGSWAPATPIFQAPAAAPTGLTVDGLSTPADLENLAETRLSWIGPAGTSQRGYEIVVSAAHRGNLWHSGKVVSGQQTDIAYGGAALGRSERYSWSVRIWDVDRLPRR
jgi:alpha-L-rhamnosidase